MTQAVDGNYELARIATHESSDGVFLRRDARQGDATAAIKKIAYKRDHLL